jgi:hypothetical protein
MQRSFASVLVATLILLPGLAPAERQPLAVIELTSCNAFSGNVNSLAQAINVPFIGMGVNGWLSQATSCPNLTGVDVNKPLLLMVLPAETEGAPITAAVLPLLDQGELMLGALRGAFKTSTQDGDIHAFAGAQAGLGNNDVFVAVVGNQAVTSSSRDGVTEIAGALKANTLPTVATISGTLRATLDIQALVPLLDKMFASQAAMMRTIQPQPGQPNPAEMLQLQQSALLTVLRQMDTFSIGLTADGSGVTFYTRADPVTNSVAARVFAMRRPPDRRYPSLLPPNALFALVGTGLDSMDLLAEPYAAFTDGLYAKMGAPFTQMGPLVRQSLTDAKGLYKGDFALAVTPSENGKGVEFVEYIAVKDEQAATRLLRTGMTNTMALLDTGAKTGFFGLQTGTPRRVGKIEVLPFHYTFNMKALPVPAPFLSWLDNLYGESAVAHGHMVMVMSGSNTVASAMDRALAGLAKPAAGAAPAPRICTLFPESQLIPVTEWRLDSSALLRLILTATGPANAGKLALLPPRGDGIGGIELLQGQSLFGALRISASELTSLAKAFAAFRTQARPNVTPPPSAIPPHMKDGQP